MQGASRSIQPALILLTAAAVAWLAALAIEHLVRRTQSRSSGPIWLSMQRRCRRPFRITLAIAAVLIALPSAGLSGLALQLSRQVLVLVLIGVVAWLLIRLSRVAEDLALTRIDVDVSDNRRARRLRTQILLFRRMIAVLLIVVAFAAAAMTIPSARAVGASFLVSAGVLSVVAGLAAQATLANLLAGLQIAFTDPIRIDDVVVVNEEWGRIHEITLTYVVVRTWDNRRLILPISWFTNHAFQNWTRNEARVVGSIVLHVDFTVPVDDLRSEMYRLVQESPLWDGLDWVLQVVDTTPTTVVLRGLVSSFDAPTNWDLRCEIREKLLLYLQTRHRDALPRFRADLSPTVEGRWEPGQRSREETTQPATHSGGGAGGAAEHDDEGVVPSRAATSSPDVARRPHVAAQPDDENLEDWMSVMAVPRFKRFFRIAASLDVDKEDLKRFSDFVSTKLYDLLVIAQGTAKANDRDIIEPRDLPITKGLQERIHEFRPLDEVGELAPILEQLATWPPLDVTVSEETEARLPGVVGGLSVGLARTFKIVDPDTGNPSSEDWERAFRLFSLLL
jgi:small-conductance mechanosensitive channel